MSKLDQIESLEAKIAVRLDQYGHEVPDPTPMALPSGFRRPETLAEQVKRLVRTTLSQQAAEAGHESFEESEDFDVDDDFDPQTPYEVFFDPALNREISPDEFNRNYEIYKQRYIKAHDELFKKIDTENIMAENLYRRAHRDKSGGEGVSPSPSSSSSEPKAPPAEQS